MDQFVIISILIMNIVSEITFANELYNTIKEKMDCKINISRLMALPFLV